jgi:hypothetical protein
MLPYNYTRIAIKALRSASKGIGKEYNYDLHQVIKRLEKSVKFMLPVDGIQVDDPSLKGLHCGSYLKLPYVRTVLEYQTSFSNYDAVNIVTLAEEVSSEIITVTHILCLDGEWNVFPVIGEFERHHNLGADSDDSGLVKFGRRYTKMFEDKVKDGEVTRNDFGAVAEVGDILSFRLLSFLNALSCSNVIEHQINHVSKKRKALGYDEYKILTIDYGKEKKARTGSGNSIDSRRRPRTHLRRGHIRRYSSGLAVWVNACIVNDGAEGGNIDKDYNFVA